MKISLIFFSFILFSSCSLVVSTVANIKDINPITGEYSIGTQRFFFIDSSRTNWYLDGYDKYIWIDVNQNKIIKCESS